MAYRLDISVDWLVSPRIITIQAPSTLCSMQDLYDTLRFLEARSVSMDDKPIVDASGKEPLDASGTKVGITVSLLDAIVGFEARLDWTECTLDGGNLVGYDTNGSITTPINPTAYVNITRTSSASATLQEQDALQYASYGGFVSLNLSSPHTGVVYPVGNMEYNVNNVPDAISICNTKGFDTIRIKGLVPLSEDYDITYKILLGTNPLTSLLEVADISNTVGVICKNLTFSGKLDGGNILEHCILGEVKYFNGYINDCILTSNVIFIKGVGLLVNSMSGANCESPPIIDLYEATSLGIRGFTGDLLLRGKVGLGSYKIEIAGELTIDSTCTTGEIIVYGTGYVTDNSTGDFILIDRTTGTPQEIAEAILNIDVECT